MQRTAGRIVSLAAVGWLITVALAQGGSVRGRFSASDPNGPAGGERDAGVVVWLSPVAAAPGAAVDTSRTQSRTVSLLQKNKRFDPHVLVVEVGTMVGFPNRDPFFHNVFSLFEGKRFDLGLYEAGSTRSVRFDRPGVCFIFCDIHSEMSAVVVVVNTPYFAVSNKAGEFEIPEVPAGRYQMNVWAERCLPKTLKDLSRPVTVGEEGAVLGTIHLEKSGEPIMVHQNKYGQGYDPQVFSSPVYTRP